jgi:hypothetical protein
VADLLAIIAHEPGDTVPADALERLIADYESLRGAAPKREAVAAGRAQACVLGQATQTSGVEHDGAGWTAWAGALSRRPGAMGEPLADLDGQFALVRVESDGESVRVATDPLGMKPLFLAASGERTYVSTSALVLAKHLGATPSRLGLEAFLRSGLQFGQATQWEGIERMRPAECRVFDREGRRTETYWRPRLEQDVGRLSLAESAELCIERATGAIAERYRGERPWIDLTGGFDSRLLSLLVRNAGVEAMANTVGEPEDEDVRLARRVATAAGWPWTRIGLPRDWTASLPELVPAALAWGDGHLDALALTAVLRGHREKSEAGTLLLNGGGGEEFRDHPWGHELAAAGRSSTVNYARLIAWRILLPVDLSAMRSDPTGAVTAAFREQLEARARPFEATPNTFQDDLLYAYKMTGHSGAYQAAAGASLDLEVPFYLRPILFNVIGVAPRHRRFHRLMRAMTGRLDPGIAAIPTETGGPAEPLRPGNLHRFAPYAWRRGRRLAVRARGRLPDLGGSTAEPNADPQEVAQSALVAELSAEGRLDPARMRSASLYDAERLTKLLDRAVANPAAVDWSAVGRIVTVELALEAAGAGLE